MIGILIWLVVICALVYFIVRWAQGEAVINNQASGLSSVERDDAEPLNDGKPAPRMAGTPMSYPPQEGVRELAAQLRKEARAKEAGIGPAERAEDVVDSANQAAQAEQSSTSADGTASENEPEAKVYIGEHSSVVSVHLQ